MMQTALDVINANATAYQAACNDLRERLNNEEDKESSESKALQCFLRRSVKKNVSELRAVYVKRSSQLRAWPPNTPMVEG